MSALSQIANQLLLPPGGFIVLLLTALLLALLPRVKARGTENRGAIDRGAAPWRAGRLAYKPGGISLSYLLLAAAMSIYLLSLAPVAHGLLSPLEGAYPGRPPAAFADLTAETQAIVVLGGGISRPSPEEEQNASLSPSSFKRLLFAFRIQRETGLPIIATGGSPEKAPEGPAEAQVAADLLRELGTSEKLIRTETASHSTFENARNLAAAFTARRIILVTSASHMARSVRTFSKQGFQVFAAPTDYWGEEGPWNAWDLLPSMESLYGSYLALHEYLGRLWYELAYW